MQVMINGIGVMAPGLAGWQQARAVLAGETPYAAVPLAAFRPELLPPNERRRTTALIKLALQTAGDALSGQHEPLTRLASVFASAEGDTEIVDRICRALWLPERPVSPTQFHNSVHNAPAGYWAIASGSHCVSTSLAGGADTFATGLLDAATLLLDEGTPVLFIAYDYPLPAPLAGRGYATEAFAAALLLTLPSAAAGEAGLHMTLTPGVAAPVPLPAGLTALRHANPIAACLPLLQLLAQRRAGTVALACGSDLSLQIAVQPC